ncbi:SAM-dependent methyltransferase [Achromobacter xylosoxidans]|uniref:N-6 DNA methylase n=1 Tax=Alcaligenes xylosoxydans xylosoxydans TaxID=85698 RepID=UPI001F059C6F|nr:N-6 DNA methylase [Achromobacter xylosoxidans]MCH1986486.1 SAM-dependent methyltransferase [Achromobacter xylosoxidans]MCH1992288.1 SAM-dependent methyltransferase [Achromobacter xylosoxidans]MCH4586607.1 SAM-dependent methyltransferase [Achromobacter xylosoxidans]
MAKTSNAQQRRFLNNADAHQKEIVGLLRQVAHTRGIDRVWSDWVEICAIALARADLAQQEVREQRYLQVIAQYERAELDQLVQAFAHLVMSYELRVEAADFGDVLGSTFMMLDMGNAGAGQFFTPYEVSRLMGNMMMGDGQALVDKANEQGFLRVLEPACGAGGMLIAAAHAMHEAGLNYQQRMHATAIDIDQRCVHMTFIQLALLHVPAVVIHGNGLTGECRGQWFTPAHILGGWSARLRRREAEEGARALLQEPVAKVVARVDLGAAGADVPEAEQPLQVIPKAIRQVAAAGQMSLF